MAPKCLPPELLFELVPLFPVEETLPNVFLSCRLLHNFLLPRVDKWKEEMQRNTEEMDRKFEEMEKRLTTKFEQFREDTFELLDTIVERIEDGNKEIAHFCRHTAQTMDLLALNITTSVSAFKRRKQQCGQDTDSAMTAERTFGGGQLTAAAPSAATSAACGGEFGAKVNNFGGCVPSTTSPICPNDKVSLSTAIRQGRLDNPGVDSAIKSNCEKSDKALFYEHAESLQSLLHDFPRKLRNECTDRTSINIAISDFEARFMSSLDEMNSVMNGLRSSIDAEEVAKLKEIVQTLSKWALHIHEKAENVSKVSTIGNLFTPLSGGLQHLASELRGQLPRDTDANAQQRAPQRQPAKSFEPFETASDRKESTEKGQTKQGREIAAAGLTSSNESNSLGKGRKKQGKEFAAAGHTPTDELDITASIVPTSVQTFRRTLSETGNRMRNLVRSLTKNPTQGI